MIKKELLEILCCPKCKGALREERDKELLRCVACGQQYPVKDGIPIMLPEK